MKTEKRMSRIIYLLVFLFFNLPIESFAQIIEGNLKINSNRQKHILLFRADIKKVGKIIYMTDELIKFKTKKGPIVVFYRDEILKIIAEPTFAAYSLHENLGYSTTAFNLQKNEKRYNNFDVLFNSYSQGITDKISFTGAILIPPTFTKSDAFLFLVARIKFTHSISKNIHVGIAPTIFYFHDDYSSVIHPFPTGVITFGTPSKFLNFTIAKGFDIYKDRQGELKFEEATDYYSLGGSIDINNKWTILMDNVLAVYEYDIEELELIPSVMLKGKLKQNQFIQLGFGIPIEFDEYWGSIEVEWGPLLPIISYSMFW